MRFVMSMFAGALVCACAAPGPASFGEPCSDAGCVAPFACSQGFCVNEGSPPGSPCLFGGITPANGLSAPCDSDICFPLQRPDGGVAPSLFNELFTSDVYGVCTNHCRTDADCIPGWTCEEAPELDVPGRVCVCSWAPEVCDGKDNDCDGIIDDGPGPVDECLTGASGDVCTNGSCACGVEMCGACVDTSVDAENCGTCGHACPTGQTCAGGECVTTGIVARNLAGPVFVTADTANVYWLSVGAFGLSAQPLAGGQTTTVTDGGLLEEAPLAMTTDGVAVFALTTNGGSGDGDVYEIPLATGQVADLAPQENPSLGIAVDAENVYYTRGYLPNFLEDGWIEDDDVISVSRTNAQDSRILAQGQPLPWGIVVDDTNVYWANFGNGTIMSEPKGGGTPVMLATGQGGPTAIALDGQNLYWTNMGVVTADAESGDGVGNGPSLVTTIEPHSGSIATMPVTGGTPVTLATSQDFPTWGIVTDGTSVYWLNSTTPYERTFTGAVMKVAIAGGEPVTLASNQNHPWSLALSNNTLFWTVGDNAFAGWGEWLDGAVLKMSLPPH